jgi:hypothetical protein
MASMNPQIRDLYSPLEELIMQALRRHGEFTPSTYWTGLVIDPYISIQDAREVPDNIIVLGMLFHYAIQQHSSKSQMASEKYFRTMNQTLYRTKHGTERPVFNQSFR